MCCLHEVIWRGQGTGMAARCRLCWSGKGVGGVGVMVKEELCENKKGE